MATSTPRRKSPQAPPAAPRWTRKPSAKVLEIQQSLETRTKAQRSAQNEAETIVVRSTQDEPPPDAPQPTQDELPPFPTARAAIYPEHERGSAKLEEVAKLIAGLKETIAQQSSIIASQNSIIESVKTDLATIKAEQQTTYSLSIGYLGHLMRIAGAEFGRRCIDFCYIFQTTPSGL